MVEAEVIWQQRLDKQNKIIAAYKALYNAQEKELSKLEPDSLEYCRLNINQLQLADEIEAKEMFADRIVKDKKQQLQLVAAKALFVQENDLTVISELKKRISSPLVKSNEKTHCQALLGKINNSEGTEYDNAVYNAATVLGLIK